MSVVTAGHLKALQILIADGSGQRIGGLATGTIVCDIRCATPGHADYGKYWDFGGVTPQFRASGWTTRQAQLAVVDGTNALGWYGYAAGWNTTGLAGTYVITYDLTSAVDTTSAPASEDVIVLASGSSAASTAEVNAARDVVTGAITAIAGAGFTSGTDDLRHLSNRLTSVDDKISITQSRLGLLNEFTVLVGSTTTVVQTNCAFPDGTWTGKVLVALNPSSPVLSTATRVVSQIGGVFTVSPALPWIPDTGDPVIVRADLAPATPVDLSTSQGVITTAVNTRMATFTYIAPPSAQDISTLVNSDLTAAHGSGSYTAQDVSSLATTAQLNTAVTTITAAITAVPAAVWVTALPGSFPSGSAGALLALAGALAPPSAATIAAAMRDLPEGTPTAGSYGAAWVLGRRMITNRLEETAGSPGTARLYADDGTTVLLTWAIRAGAADTVTTPVGEPARRGAAT